MIRLYAGSGSWEIQVLGESLGEQEWQRKRELLVRLLQARDRGEALRLLNKLPFRLFEGTNFFGDEFQLLYARLPVEQYVEFASLDRNRAAHEAATALVKSAEEIGLSLRFVAFEPEARDEIPAVSSPEPQITAATVSRALNDIERLLSTNGPVSAVDRAHTAIYGYLREICKNASIDVVESDGMTTILKKLRANHPAFAIDGPAAEHVTKIGNALATILDAMNPVRNRASVAHPNEELVDDAEAMLVINTGRTLIHYLNTKVSG